MIKIDLSLLVTHEVPLPADKEDSEVAALSQTHNIQVPYIG